jgi:hypothetical protein
MDGLQDHSENFTRFVLVKRKPMSGRIDPKDLARA